MLTGDVFDRLASLGTPPVGYTYRPDGLIATRAKAVFVFDPEEGEWVEQWQPSTFFYHDGAEPVIERQSGAVTAITVRGRGQKRPASTVPRRVRSPSRRC